MLRFALGLLTAFGCFRTAPDGIRMADPLGLAVFVLKPLECKDDYSATLNNMKLGPTRPLLAVYQM